jgi:hypothetical protein
MNEEWTYVHAIASLNEKDDRDHWSVAAQSGCPNRHPMM